MTSSDPDRTHQPLPYSHHPAAQPPSTIIDDSASRRDDYEPLSITISQAASRQHFAELDADPDAFYRPYSTRSTALPDIFIQDDSHTMSPKRKPVGAAGTNTSMSSGTRPLPSVSASTAHGASRSAAHHTPATGAQLQPTTNGTSGRTSIKDRVKQLEKAKSGDARSVSAVASAKPASRLQKSTPRDQTQNDGSPHASRKQSRDVAGRQPLFGEITGSTGVGYGIPVLTKQRSNLETSMPTSIASSRSHSSCHQPSSSEETEIEVDGPSVPTTSNSISPSRIPVPRPRRASDYSLASDVRPRTPTSNHSPRHIKAGVKTPGSSKRRYSPRRHAENNTSLTAVISEPLPKLSPPLRSSRPRQPVSAASTAASRARVSERFTSTIAQQAKPRSAPKDVPRVDVASRRDAVQTHLARTYVGTKVSATASSAKSTSTIPKTVDSPQFPGAFPESPSDYFEQNAVAGASEDVSDSSFHDDGADTHKQIVHVSPRLNGYSPFEEDGFQLQHHAELSRTLDSGEDDAMLKGSALSKNVWILRQDSPTTSEPRLPEDMLSDIGDGETINVVLGSTPVLPQSNFQAPEPSPVPIFDDDRFDFRKDRATLSPDDSISVVFQRQSTREQDYQIPPVPALPKIQTSGIETLDSAARSQVNHFLAQYQQDGSPQLSQPYEDYIDQLTPSMAAHAQFASESASPLNLAQTQIDPSNANPLIKSADAAGSLEEGPAGTAIIFTTNDSHDSVTIASASTAKNKPLTQPRQVESLQTVNVQNGPLSRKGSYASQRQSEEYGYAYVTTVPSTSTPDSPAPPNHAPPLPPSSSKASSIRENPDLVMRKESWRLATSPIPRTRPRKDTYDTDGGSVHRASRTSRPETLSSATRKSIDTASSEKSGSVTRAEKDLKQRWHIIKELVDTEHKFVYDMYILVDIFMATSGSVPSLAADDRRCIFGNADKVRDASSRFLEALKRSASAVYQIPPELRYQPKRSSSADTSRTGDSGKTLPGAGSMPERDAHSALDRKTNIGATFLAHADELDKVYRSYMINHSSMNKRRLAIMADKKVKMWLDECVAVAKDMSGIWSLDSMTIKPTQRYLKYHLLLRQILDHTPSDHPDYEDIEKALEIFTSASQSINDNARKREITGTLLTESKLKPKKISFRDMIMARSKNARSRSATTSAGTVAYDPQYDPNDNSYEAIRQRFGGHFFQLQIVMRDFEKYLDDKEVHLKQIYSYALNLKANYRCDLGYNRFPEWESRIHQFVELIESIQRHAWPAHQESVKKFVISPVRKLWRMHDNPQHLMFKHRKLKVSLQKYLAAKDKNDVKTQDRYRDEAKNWEVLNDVLINELPQLYAFTKQTVHACLKNFLDIEARWNVMWLNKLKHFCGDYDANMFFENDIDVFYAAVMDEFRRDTEEVDYQLANMALAQAQGEGIEGISISMPEPEGGLESASATEYRAHRSTRSGSKRPANLPTPYNANGSSEQARSTPNLNLGVGSIHATNRLSDYRTDSSSHRFGLLGQQSVSGSAGPTTPTYTGPLSAGHQRQVQTPSENDSFSWRPIDSPSSRPDTSGYASFTTEERLQHYHDLEAVQKYHDAQHGAREKPKFTSALPGEWPIQATNGAERSIRNASISQPPSQAHSRNPSHSQQEDLSGDDKVLFVAASLFEFRIDSSLRERGYPYLQYVAGDIFDIVKDDGELWLARNQDEPEVLGWLWSKHAALLAMDFM